MKKDNKMTVQEVVSIAMMAIFFAYLVLTTLIATTPTRQKIQSRLDEYNCRVLLEETRGKN